MGKHLIRNFKFAMYPSKLQTSALNLLVQHQLELLNVGLKKRVGVNRWNKQPLLYSNHYKILYHLKHARSGILECGVPLCGGTQQRLDRHIYSLHSIDEAEFGGFRPNVRI